VHRPALAQGELPAHPGDHLGGGDHRPPTRSTPATASSRRTPTSPRSAACAGSVHRARAGGHPPDGRQGDRRQKAVAAGMPMLPGSPSRSTDEGEALASSPQIGYPADHQGGGGRRWPGHEDRVGRGEIAQGPSPSRAPRRESAFGNGADLPRALHPEAAAHRVPGRRTSTARRPPRRARVLHPAPSPEADRGGTLAGGLGRATRRDGRAHHGGAVRAVGYTSVPARWSILIDERVSSTSWR
jgi:hypothetical protein